MQTTNVKNYEIHDHLGNVRMTISDTKDPSGQAVALSASNYYAFGSPMPMKTVTPTSRFGFNSIEMDNEVAGSGNHYTALYGEYDPRVIERWNKDPKTNASYSPYSLFSNNPVWHSDILLDTPSVKEAAYIADNVYGPDKHGQVKSLYNQWTKVDISIPGVTYNDPKSGYAAGLYKKIKPNGNAEYVFATRGTEMTSGKDWLNNLEQPLGLSAQYKLNAKNAIALQKYFGSNTDLTFVGHSLGGGLAAANSMVTGHPAITFNAAGISLVTKAEINTSFLNFGKSLFTPLLGNINAYIVRGEILDQVQRQIGLQADGKIHKIAPSLFSWYRYDPTGISDHTMSAVKNAIDNENIK